MELWNAYDRDFHIINGITLIRGEPVPEGMYHLVCEILVQHTDGSLLLMQRDPRKACGGQWEASAGGSALRGETPLEGAKRELYEETGITAEDIREVGRVVSTDTIYAEFLCITDCAKDSVTLQEGETVDYRWVSWDTIRAMTPDELMTQRMWAFVS